MEGGLKGKTVEKKTSHETGEESEQAELPEVSQEKKGMAKQVPPPGNPRSSTEVSSSKWRVQQVWDTGHRA